MTVIELNPYKGLQDDELLINIYNKTKLLRELSSDIDDEEYWKEAKFFNEMIIEAKRRKLKVSGELLLRNIFQE